MEGEQLQRDDAQDALQAVHAMRHFDAVGGPFMVIDVIDGLDGLDGLVILFVADHDGAPLAGHHLLQGVLTFGVGVVSHDDHDDRHEFIHQGQRAVFELSSQDSL